MEVDLTGMQCRNLIDDETFIRERNGLQSKISRLKERLRETGARAEGWLELTEKAFGFARYTRKAFLAGDLGIKKEIPTALSQNPTVRNVKLRTQANEWLQPMQSSTLL